MNKLLALLVAACAVPTLAADKKVTPQQCEQLAKHSFEVILAGMKDDPEVQQELRRIPKQQRAAVLAALVAEFREEEQETVKEIKKGCLEDVRDGVIDQQRFACAMRSKTQVAMETCLDE